MPNSIGHLNRQLIYLLSGLKANMKIVVCTLLPYSCRHFPRKVPDKVFLELQEEMFLSFRRMYTEPEVAMDVLCWDGQFDQALMVARIAREALEENTRFSMVRSRLHVL